MNSKFFNQIVLSVFVLAIGVWAFFEYKQSQKEEVKKTNEAQFLKKELKDLKAFRIKKEHKILEVVKEDKDWILKSPVKDLADWKEISRWFDEIKNQKIQKIEIKTDIKWEDYYLNSAPSVEMEFSSGESLSFSVSKKSSFDGKYFIKKGADLLIGEAYFSSEVNNKEFDSFRSKKLLPSLGHASAVRFQAKEDLTVHWANYKWSQDKSSKKIFPLDSDRLDGFWTDINSMETTSIKEAVSSASLNKYGLNKPQMEIHFSYPDEEKNYLLKLSPFKEDKAFVSIPHRNFIMEISQSEAEKLILNQKEIRDHSFPFNYKKDLAEQIERKNEKKSFVIKKAEDTWKYADKETKKETTADAKKISELLDKMKELRGEKYKTGSIKQSNRSMEIKDDKGELIFELKEASSSDKIYSWVQTNLWNELTAVSKTDLNKIFNHNIKPDPEIKEEKKAIPEKESKE